MQSEHGASFAADAERVKPTPAPDDTVLSQPSSPVGPSKPDNIDSPVPHGIDCWKAT